MRGLVRASAVMLMALTIITGGLYPAVITVLGQLLFPAQANGSLVIKDGRVIGSELIGQQFTDPKYFWGRPSATTPPYNAASSGGSNLAASNSAHVEAVKARVAALQAADPSNSQPIPIDLVTASASGLDPHISPAAASYQAARVARARGMSDEAVQALINQFTEGPSLLVFGEPHVNVLELNLALDAAK